MVETVSESLLEVEQLFEQLPARPLEEIPLLLMGRDALLEADAALGLALEDSEIDYLVEAYASLGRNPTDVELMMFAQRIPSIAGIRFFERIGGLMTSHSRTVSSI